MSEQIFSPYAEAVRLAQLGFKVFPANNRDARKMATSDPTKLAEFYQATPGANWRALCGNEAGLLVLDTQRAADAQILMDTFGRLPRTWISQREGGGLHRWFSIAPTDPELRTRDRLLTTSAILKSSVPVPGSIYRRRGARYEWLPGLGPDDRPIARLPDEWFDELPKEGGITATITHMPEFTPRVCDDYPRSRW